MKKRNGEPTEKEERKIALLVYHLYGLVFEEVLIIAPRDGHHGRGIWSLM